MSLSKKQREFTRCIGLLIEYAYSKNIELTMGDAYRDPRVHGEFGEKKSYAHKNSVHKLRLAQDFNVWVNGKYIADGSHPAYGVLGEYWETLSEHARWGGRFGDANHFSFEHWGAM
ncbi:hypothetical protein [Teredinibacter turnerae]|uniref:hypothetical protein n=1 Tax=Teredinibacter turnerae TaxID=2426 RepID=UPI0030D6114B